MTLSVPHQFIPPKLQRVKSQQRVYNRVTGKMIARERVKRTRQCRCTVCGKIRSHPSHTRYTLARLPYSIRRQRRQITLVGEPY